MNTLPEKNTVCRKEKIILVRFVVVNLTKVNVLRDNVQIFYMFLYKERKDDHAFLLMYWVIFPTVPPSPC